MSNASTSLSRSAAIRARLSHPIIDSDGHVAEFEPAFFDYLERIGGLRMVDELRALGDSPFAFRWYRLTPGQCREHRAAPAMVGASRADDARSGDQLTAQTAASPA